MAYVQAQRFVEKALVLTIAGVLRVVWGGSLR